MSSESRCRRRLARPVLAVVSVAVALLLAAGAPPPHEAFEGQWSLRPKQSSPVDPWGDLSLEIDVEGSRVTIEHHWSAGRFASTDSMTIETGGAVNRVPAGRWLDNRHLNISIPDRATREVTARWLGDGRTLQVVSRFPVQTSQGRSSIRILNEYRLGPDRQSLALLQLRSTRPRPVHYLFRRPEKEST